MELGKEKGLIYINGFDHPDIIAGQGSVGVEILEDVPDVDYVVVPIGGGGLISGITAAIKHLKPEVKIIVSKFVKLCILLAFKGLWVVNVGNMLRNN
jgi:threonine dehydratase